jgi:hypothetical protein
MRLDVEEVDYPAGEALDVLEVGAMAVREGRRERGPALR